MMTPQFMRAAAVVIALLPAAAWRGMAAEKPVTAVLPPNGKFTYLERSDLRRYESGKFVGLEHREVRGILQQSAGALAAEVEGTFYVMQALDHSGAETAQEIDEAVSINDDFPVTVCPQRFLAVFRLQHGIAIDLKTTTD